MMEDQDVDDHILDNDGGDDPSSAGWSDADRLIAASCVGMVKTAKNCVKKLTEALTNSGACDPFTVSLCLKSFDTFLFRMSSSSF